MATIDFHVDRTQIAPGECVIFSWQVDGVKAVYFYAEGQRWEDHGVVGAGRHQVCPDQQVTYNLRVVKPDNSVEIRQITVQVVAPDRHAPQVRFEADRTTIQAGECATFFWHVQNVRAVYFYAEGQRWEDHGVVGEGRAQVCPPKSTTYNLRVVKPDNSIGIHQIPIQVQALASSGPAPVPQPPKPPAAPKKAPPPPPPPKPTMPVVDLFRVTPSNISQGASVEIEWRCSGPVHWIQIGQGERVLVRNAPHQGKHPDTPPGTGQLKYWIMVWNPEDKWVRGDAVVTAG
jgi:hypothetical protein